MKCLLQMLAACGSRISHGDSTCLLVSSFVCLFVCFVSFRFVSSFNWFCFVLFVVFYGNDDDESYQRSFYKNQK